MAADAPFRLDGKSSLGVPVDRSRRRRAMVVFLASDEPWMATGGTFSVTAGDSANAEA